MTALQPADGSVPPRLVDVAARAGVSKGTASKALNGRSGTTAATRARVEHAARDLGFRPSAIARSLVEGRTKTIGILANDLDGRFVLPILAGAEEALSSSGWSVILCDARGQPVREQQLLRTLADRQIDGLIVVGGAHNNPRTTLSPGLGTPTVYAYAPSDDPSDVSIVSDDRGGGRVAAEHLWSTGKRHVAYLGGDPSFDASRERQIGVREALEERGGRLIDGLPTHGDWSERWARAFTARLLTVAPEVDAVVCGADGLARGVLDMLRDERRAVPQDIAVTGYDNWAVLAENASPRLTSIDMDLPTLGRTAAVKVLEALGGAGAPPGIYKIPARLVARESTG